MTNLDIVMYKVGEKIPDSEILRQLTMTDLNRYRENAGKITRIEATLRIKSRDQNLIGKPLVSNKRLRLRYKTLVAQDIKSRSYNSANIGEKFRTPIILGRIPLKEMKK
ncbi:MAG: hypothetical protein ACTSP6_06065 [Promethearchaeota archaeon]